MSHVIQDHRVETLCIDKVPYLSYRLLVKNHAFAENDQLRLKPFNKKQGGRHIDFVRIFFVHGKLTTAERSVSGLRATKSFKAPMG